MTSSAFRRDPRYGIAGYEISPLELFYLKSFSGVGTREMLLTRWLIDLVGMMRAAACDGRTCSDQIYVWACSTYLRLSDRKSSIAHGLG